MTDPSAAPGPTTPGSTSLLQLTAALLSRWRLIVALGLTGAIVAAAWALLATPRYRAVGKYALEERRQPSAVGGLAALAGQLGGALGGVRSLQFYADVLVGREILRKVALDTFPDPASGTRRPLIDILEIRGDTPAERETFAIERLEKAANTSTNDRTGTITLEVSLPDPELAAAVGRRMYDHLEEFNFETRRSAASERREFAARELVRARSELADAEAAMRSFLEANRAGLEIPRLNFQRQQHQRRIEVLNELYGRLARELQEAKVDEVRDTPVFTVVQQPEPPVYRDFPRRTRMTLAGGLMGGAAAVLWIVLAASARSARELDPAGFAALHGLRRRASA